jgi:superfamily II DNA or RNA helicase
MQLRDYQQAAVDGAYKLWREGKRSVIITMATGCHARGQGILMYDGSVKAVEDVVVGDRLMGPDSTPRTVLSLARGRQEMATIVPDHGRPWTVNMSHVLTIAPGVAGGPGQLADRADLWLDITVEEYVRSLVGRRMATWPDEAALIRCTPDGNQLVGFHVVVNEPVDDYFGFSLDGDQRYLLDDFTVTHNSGKSVVFKKFAHDVTMRGHRVLLLVEGQDLVEQAANHMRVAGLRVAVEMADQRVNTAGGDLLGDGPQVVVASIDSMVRRFARYPVEFFGLIITDECHHAASPSYRKVFGHFGFPVPREPEDGGGKYPAVGTCKMVGLTATPDRSDKKQLVPDIFEECAFDYPIKQAIEDGWLVPVKQVLCHLPGYDISKVRTVAGDLNAGELAEVLEPLIKPMVEEIVKVSERRRRTLVYSVLKKLAHATTEALVGAGAGNVCTIVGETPRSSSVAANDSGTAEQRWPDRERMFEAFRRGDLPFLSSVATLIEGVDLPEAEVAAVLRPTKSGLVYTQIAGRVFRPLPGIVDGLKTAEERRAAIAASAKPCCIILDFAGNAGRHKLVRVLDLFADGLTEAQRKAADKLIESGECTDVLEAIERAREIIAEMERERAGRGVTSTNVDPFDVLAIPYARDQFDRPATEGQLMTLLRHGAIKGNIDKDRDKMLALAREKFDRTSASMYIDVVIQRTKAKQSTIKQAMLLVGKGIPAAVAKEMSFDRASAAMTELASMGWKPTPAWLDKYRKPRGEVAA